jgi:hypothetical protein
MGSVVINGPSGNDEVDAVEGQTSPPATIMIATLKRWPQPPLTLGLNVTLWDWLGPPGTHSAQSAVIGRQLPLACRGRYGPGCRTLAFGGIAVGSKWDRGRECVFFLLHIPGALWSQAIVSPKPGRAGARPGAQRNTDTASVIRGLALELGEKESVTEGHG